MLTQKQNQLLSFLIKRIEDGISPSYEEICIELSLKSKSGIHRIVKSLEERGYVERLENKARAIAPKKYTNGQAYITNVINLTNNFLDKKSSVVKEPKNSNTEQIPLLGKIAAGTPIEAISNYDEFIEVPSSYISSKECFALYVDCLLFTSPSPRDGLLSRMPSSG